MSSTADHSKLLVLSAKEVGLTERIVEDDVASASSSSPPLPCIKDQLQRGLPRRCNFGSTLIKAGTEVPEAGKLALV